MPDDSDHIQAATHAIATAKYLIDGGQYADWAAAIVFYASLHIVDAILFCDPRAPRKHGGTHSARRDILRGTTRYRNIYLQYGPLSRASNIARYLEDADSGHTRLFTDFISASKVESELVRHRLWQLIRSASNFLPANHNDSLKGTFKKCFPEPSQNQARGQARGPDSDSH